MYVTPAQLTALFGDYRDTLLTRDRLKARVESLTASAKSRERRRKHKADLNLQRARKGLAEVSERLFHLRASIADIGYEISEKYMPRFYLRPADGENSAVQEIDKLDMIQAGVTRLIIVAHRFDPAKGKIFAWITQILKAEWLQVIRRLQHNQAKLYQYQESKLPDRKRGGSPEGD